MLQQKVGILLDASETQNKGGDYQKLDVRGLLRSPKSEADPRQFAVGKSNPKKRDK